MKKKHRYYWSILGILISLAMPSGPAFAETTPVGQIISGAISQTSQTLYYDPAYTQIPYPNGDLPSDRGVCTDVVIRAFRKGGVDLQALVHQDMQKNFSAYPKTWGLKQTDANIDHRRVPNLMTFFARKGKSLPVTQQADDYLPGDVVAWRLSNGLLHVGLVTDRPTFDTKRRLVVHNIGQGARLEDVLFAFQLIGHYRYF
ncbi:MAG: DUF1287 domain-containing protein [Deltaproteobacteria bacterium]|nr:DUF1287 domain-containing protein [Deltaproteobacteria bacterium]